jgi:tetratricopeptide (TPR) repeat protein
MRTLSGRISKVMVVTALGSAIFFIALTALTALIALTAFTARAEKMDAEIHTVVIQKLEQSLEDTREDSNLSLRPVRARLADLYAERARLRAMNEAEANCTDCKGALDDRQRSLRLYDVVLSEAPAKNRGPLILQMAQMRELNGEFKKAEALYDQLVNEGKNKHSNDFLAEAYVGRAEARFSRGEMARAQKDFEQALKLVKQGRKGQILSRIAWCHLNRGNQSEAVRTLVNILESPQLLTRESSTGLSYDASFHDDIARDLATFFARGDVSRREIHLLERLTPDASKKETLRHFASECERLGQKKAAIEVWAVETNYESTPEERLETKVRIAQIRFDLGDKLEALLGMRGALADWSKNGCTDVEICGSLRLRLRNLVIAWNKSEKKQPSSLLIDAYLAYVGHFPEDMEMTIWAAEVARSLKRYAIAASLFYKSALLASGSKEKDAGKILEMGLVGEVEMAEISKDLKTREASYDHYLALNPNGAIANKIRYQRAHVAYERGDMNEASHRFHEFASSSSCLARTASPDRRKLCIQAADLDLDSLVGMKAHSTVQARGVEYARVFPTRSKEYSKMSRTAVLKQAEGKEPSVAIAKLAEADFTGATTAERVNFLKTYLAFTERGRDIEGTRRAAETLAKTKGIAEGDYQLALAKQAWAAEMALDFERAYNLTRKMKLGTARAEDRAMKLALLAELADRNPRTHELDFLRLSRDGFQKALVQAKIVRRSKHPLMEFGKFERNLRSHPVLMANLGLDVFARTGNLGFARRVLNSRQVASEPAGRVLARELFLHDFLPRERSLARHRLNSASDSLVQRTLGERLRLLQSTEVSANQAIRVQDWSAQIVALSALSRENERIYHDILQLPAPKKLKGKELTKYERLVEANARGYLRKHEQIDKKLSGLWAEANAQHQLQRDYRSASPMVRSLIAAQLKRVAELAPSGVRAQIEDGLRAGAQMPSERQVAEARRDAKEQPFSAMTISKLRELEVVRGRETMVAYLDARLLKLKSVSSIGGR